MNMFTRALVAMMVCFMFGCSTSNNIAFDEYDAGEHDAICEPCNGADDELCYPPLSRNGHCFNGAWTQCQEMICKGVSGCSDDAMFEDNGNHLDECPDGCFATCRP